MVVVGGGGGGCWWLTSFGSGEVVDKGIGAARVRICLTEVGLRGSVFISCTAHESPSLNVLVDGLWLFVSNPRHFCVCF